MSFQDLLKQPLPSSYMESDENCESNECAPAEEDSNLINDVKIPDIKDDPSTEFSPVQSQTPPPIEPEPGEVKLSPDEDIEASDTMNTVATPLLISSMEDNDIKEFVNGVDGTIAETEGFLTEKTIVRFDKNARKEQLYEVAIRSCARAHKDPLYYKLETVYRMERILKAKLRRKYNSEANRKVKEYLAKAKKSKSGILSRIASKIMGKS